MSNGAADLELDHIGVEVRALGPAIEALGRLLGYRQATRPVVNSRHRVEVVFLEKLGSLPIKLIRPLDRPPTAVAKLHHLAFRARDLDRALAALESEGARVLSPPQPGEAFDDEPIAFVLAAGLNVELVATEKRRDRISPVPASRSAGTDETSGGREGE